MDGIINVRINGNHLTKDSRRAGVQHEGNATKLLIEFDKGWENLAKVVTFWNARGDHSVKVVLTTNLVIDLTADDWKYLCPIPPEAMTDAGSMTFVVDGYATKTDAEGNVTHAERHRSISDALEVISAPYDPDADESVDPTPSQAEQLQVQIDSIKDTIQNAELSAISAANSAQASQASAEASERSAQTSLSASEDAEASAGRASASAEDARRSAAEADAHRLVVLTAKNEVEANSAKAEASATSAESSRKLAAISEANAQLAMISAEQSAQAAAQSVSQMEDIKDEHAEVMATAYQVEQDANRAEAAAQKAQQIADGDFATRADVSSAVTNHNADSNAHPIIDTVTFAKYKLGMENGLVYMEEVL